jgi:hypothetical protein
MREPFDENRLAATAEPIADPVQDFDWQELYARLEEDAQDADQDRTLAEAVQRLLQLLLAAGGPRVNPQRVGLRVIALAWVLSPDYFPDSPSLHQLAERCGVGAATLAELTGRISRQIGWRNRGQCHGWNWERSERSPLR